MVVADFGVTAHLRGVDFLRQRSAAQRGRDGGQLGNSGGQIIGEIPAVCTGIGAELFLIEGLQVVEGLLGCIAQGAVGRPLEGSQIKEGGRLFTFLFALQALDRCLLPFAGGSYGLSARLVFETL